MIVIKLGGAVVAQPDSLADLAKAWQNRDGDERWVVVHGAGPQLDAALKQHGEPVRVAGLRVTSPAAAWTVLRTLDGVGHCLAAALRGLGVPTIHVPASLGLFAAEPKAVEGVQRVGTARSFDAAALERCVPGGAIAVVTPVGWDEDGPLNINADEGASAAARCLKAKRMVLATDVASVLDEAGEPIMAMTPETAHAFLASKAAQGGIIPKVQAAVAGVDAGVAEVRIGRVSCASGDGGTRFSRG